MKIRFVKHNDIDKTTYDRCILAAPNGVLYAMSWYLDVVAPGWQLLATPDYTWVMPLPGKEKFGIPYMLQPLMCQQLGIFSPEKINREVYLHFLKKIPAVYCILQLNSGNLFDQKEVRPNYLLDLRPDYKTIQSRYHANTRVHLKKACKAGLTTESTTNVTTLLEWTQQQSAHYTGKVGNMAQKLSVQAQEKGSLYVRCVRDETTSELLSGVLFFRWKDRFYYLIPVSSPQGKQTGAMRLLMDRFIAEWAGENHWIDLEGSAIPSVAQFYRSFGASPEWYPVFRNSIARIFSSY
ncbi:MAG: GNAT family N-acetyltransferase [Dysgonamonadaceae bacterium]|jgi:uncharacterized protein YqiB (DUF1249 family)|nr:GNAT family N-acetyltransferase [Dysgonamonadaceae bacterium]